jgi:oxalate---CoA ligase
MARERLPLITATQPIGLFRLGGYCNGGMVAFEVARLLRSEGHQVDFLAVVDVPFINAGIAMDVGRRLAGAVQFAVSAHEQEVLTGRVMECLWRIRSFCKENDKRRAKIAKRMKFLNDVLVSGAVHAIASHNSSDFRKYKLYIRAMASYFPKPVDIPVIHYTAANTGRYLHRITSQLEIVHPLQLCNNALADDRRGSRQTTGPPVGRIVKDFTLSLRRSRIHRASPDKHAAACGEKPFFQLSL